MPKAEEQDYKDMEKETVLFHGKSGNVTWIEFEKSIARYFRMKFGSEIGNQLWRNELPIIEEMRQLVEPSLKSIVKKCLRPLRIIHRKSMRSSNLKIRAFGRLPGT